MAPAVENFGTGPAQCLMLAGAGAEWLRATLPSALTDMFTMHLVVPSEGATTVLSVASELAAVAHDVGPAIAFGMSMNGSLALAAAAEHPDLITAVVAVTSPPRLPPDPEVVARYSYAIEPERQREFDQRRAAAEAAPPGTRAERDLWRRVDALRRWHDLSFDSSYLDALENVNLAWVQAVMADGEGYDWTSITQSVSQPVLLALGRSDFIVPPISWDLDCLPATFSVEVFQRSGHTPFYEQPVDFVATLKAWMAKLDPAS